ncbi:hypothetical protein ACRYG0_02595 [Mycobacteroides abscessus]
MWQKGLTLAGVWLVLNIVCAVVDLPHGACRAPVSASRRQR